MKLATLFFLLSLAVQSSATEITYLTCDVPSTPDWPSAFHYEVTLDESRSLVSWVDRRAESVTEAKALFTRDTVAWTDPQLRAVSMSFAVNRVDLSFTVDLDSKGDPHRHKDGKCSIDDRPRKF